MKKNIVSVLASLVVLAVAANAQTNDRGIVLKGGKQTISESSAAVAAPSSNDTEESKLRLIAGNLSHDQFGTYFCCFGQTVSGPNSNFGQIWVGVPFTPATNVTVIEIQAALAWDGLTTPNHATLSIAEDASGLPGAMIKTLHVSGMPLFGQCCHLAVAKDNAGISLTAGTQYWLVAGTGSKDLHFEGGWNFNTTDMRSFGYAQNFGGTWFALNFIEPGFAVLGR